MNENEFVKNIIMAYQNARNTVNPNARLLRGRSHSISSIAEDLFAEYLVKSDNTISKIYIDQAMGAKGSKKVFYPDIVVVKGNEIILLIDLKMDLGWMRTGLYPTCQKHHELLGKIRGKKCKDINTGKEQQLIAGLKFSDNIKYNIAVITKQNISPAALDSQLKMLNEAKLSTKVHILTSGVHPNEYGLTEQEILDKIVINKQDFKDIIKSTEYNTNAK